MSEWDYDGQPEEPGWYPIIRCWDVQEGAFPGAEYFNGNVWFGNGVSAWWPIKCKTPEEAKDIAEHHGSAECEW